MKIAVVGAGIIGITTAYELAADGHEVTVIERRSAAAEEASFANAGVIAPGYVTPWAGPGMPLKILSYLFRQHAPVKLSLPLSTRELAWIARWYRACKLETYQTNRGHMNKLAVYSRDRLHQLSSQLQLDYERSAGYLILLRSESDHSQAQAALKFLRATDLVFKEIDGLQARQIEPALNSDTPLVGAIHLPDDEVGNCRQFAMQLKTEAQKLGVVFSFQTTVEGITPSRGIVLTLDGRAQGRQFDGCVVCAGVDSAKLLANCGLRIPLAAVYGYSISAPIRESVNAPRSAVMDERFKVAISRLGKRIRVAGSAEFGGDLAKKRAGSIQTLYKVLSDWFPGAANLSGGVQEWKGARPMLPDGPPVIGASGIPQLWLNLGQGSSGWALSCGSARVMADMVSGRVPALDVCGFDPSRILR